MVGEGGGVSGPNFTFLHNMQKANQNGAFDAFGSTSEGTWLGGYTVWYTPVAP